MAHLKSGMQAPEQNVLEDMHDMGKPRSLTEKQVHFLEAWGLPMQPSFGYAHGLINYLCSKPEHWNSKGIPKKKYVVHMIDNFWKFHTKWSGREVIVTVRDKEASTIIKKSFMCIHGVVVGVVGRPVGECAFLRSKFGHVPGHLKLQVLLTDTTKAKVVGLGKIVMIRYNGTMLTPDKFYDRYKFDVENRNDDWRLKRLRGGRLLTEHLKMAKELSTRTR